jgi:hypothetical protein
MEPSLISLVPFPHQCHFAPGLVNETQRHRSCTIDACIVHNINPVEYKPAHTEPNCTCQNVKPDISHIFRILDRGEIPTISFVPSDGSLDMRVTGFSEDTSTRRYIAISHVWSDGIGSTTEDGIPLCQAQKLCKIMEPDKESPFQNAVSSVKRLFQRKSDNPEMSYPLWIDSLCIPASKAYRASAIANLGNVYRNAHGVLVLDSAIQKCSSKASPSQKLWTIINSPWMERLWTYQEANLGNNLFFKFSDGFFDFDEIHYPNWGTPILGMLVVDDMHERLSSLRYGRPLASRGAHFKYRGMEPPLQSNLGVFLIGVLRVRIAMKPLPWPLHWD